MARCESQRSWLRLARLLAEEDGVTAIEYGLVAALISVFIMVAIGAVGDAVVGLFDLTSQSFPD
jgi:pilus assembly protein Flp/PilA